MSPGTLTAVVLSALALAGAVFLARPATAGAAAGRSLHPTPAPPDELASEQLGWLRRRRLPVSVLAGIGAALVVGAPLGPVAGLAAAGGAWTVLTRAEPPGRRARREEVRRTLPHVVALFGAALRAGASPGPALLLVAEALPGPATESARGVAARLALGADPAQAWRHLAGEPGLAPFGRVMARAHETGAPVVEVVERLAGDLARDARTEVEERAHTVGVRAALPLGLCLLPAFLLVGIVPLVAGLLRSLW